MATGDWQRSLNDVFGALPQKPPDFNQAPIDRRPPTGVAPAKQGFQPRGFPESVSLDQFVPEQATGEIGGIPGAIDTAFRFPAYIPGRLPAFGDQLSKATGLSDKGVITDVVEGIRGIPIIGKPLSDLGSLTEEAFDTTFNFVGAANNAQWAALIDSKGESEGSDSASGAFGLFDELGAALMTGKLRDFLSLNDNVSYDEVEEFLEERGWDQGDFAAIRSGKAGYLYIAHKNMTKYNRKIRGINGFATLM